MPTATAASVSERSHSGALPIGRVRESVLRFASWLDRYGETSYDFQTFYASDLTRNVKALYYKSPLLGTIAVAPIIFCEAFVPSARALFWKRQRFPIADAHYRNGIRAFVSGPRSRGVLPKGGALPGSFEKHPVPGLRQLLLGISVQLGGHTRHDQGGNSSHHNCAVRL